MIEMIEIQNHNSQNNHSSDRLRVHPECFPSAIFNLWNTKKRRSNLLFIII